MRTWLRIAGGLIIAAALAYGYHLIYHRGELAEQARWLLISKKQTEALNEVTAALNSQNAAVKALKEQGALQDKRVRAAETNNQIARQQAEARIKVIDGYTPSGSTECEQTSNAVKDLLR